MTKILGGPFQAKYRLRIAILVGLCFFFSVGWSAQELPAQLSDKAFWQLITDFSEPSGRFISDNFVSNELAIQHVISELIQDRRGAGAYIGVGPEQNFTYIAALEPKIAFIIDIRRQNMIEHLMYKALIELSTDRADFMSHLFSRPRPTDLDRDSTVVTLFEALRDIEPDPDLFRENFRAIWDRLTVKHGFALTPEDEITLEYVYRAFYAAGTTLGYSVVRPGVVRILPTYEELMTDTDEQGLHRSFLATEDKFATLQRLERNNLIVPLVGDFGGPTTIRSLGKYLRDHNTTVTAFYTSNVEQYLFMTEEGWKNFYANLSRLPLNSRSVFIRPLINTGGGAYSSSPQFRVGFRWDTVLFPMSDVIAAFEAGLINSYYDVIQIPR
jgi:hypothetical protein